MTWPLPGETPGLCVPSPAGFGGQDADASEEIKYNSCFPLSQAEASILIGIQALETLISMGIRDVSVWF